MQTFGRKDSNQYKLGRIYDQCFGAGSVFFGWSRIRIFSRSRSRLRNTAYNTDRTVRNCFRSSVLLKLVEGVEQRLDLAVDVLDQLLDLALRVQQLDTLSIGVITHSEWTRDLGGELNHLLLGIVEALRDEIERLMLGDGILGHTGLLRLEGLQLRLA